MIFYIDSVNFSTATTIYLNELLTQVAPDGYYSNGTDYRRQVNGSLIEITPCPQVVCADVLIGTQTWTSCNLDVSTYRDGTLIPQVTDPTAWSNLTTGAWCYYSNATDNGITYGKLYNWYAVNDSRGLAPIGYHIPSNTELTTLTDYLGGELVAGGKMKKVGTDLWQSPNTDATNSSGFTGLPGGIRQVDGSFANINQSGYWWTSTEQNASSAYNIAVGYNYGFASVLYLSKTFGFSVRLIKD